MKPFFKSKAIVTLSIIGTLATHGSIMAASPSDALILGDWKQVEPILVEEQGFKVTLKDAQTTYTSNGTSSGEVIMVFGGLPQELGTFKISDIRHWRIEEGFLIETSASSVVKNLANNPIGNTIAAEIQKGLDQDIEIRNEIKQLTDTSLVLFVPETGMTLNFKR